MSKQRLGIVPLTDPQALKDTLILGPEGMSLRAVLNRHPALATSPVEEAWLDRPVDDFDLRVVDSKPGAPVYWPPGLQVRPADDVGTEQDRRDTDGKVNKASAASERGGDSARNTPAEIRCNGGHPTSITEEEAVHWAYAREIEGAASFLRAGLSVLMICDKLVVEHLAVPVARKAQLEPVLLTVPVEEDAGIVPRSLRQRQLAKLKELIRDLKQGDVLVIPHLDLLAGGSDSNLPTESRELVELAYECSDRLILAFADRSLELPEVLASRFAVRLLASGVPRMVLGRGDKERPLGEALVTMDEAACFTDFDPHELYKNVAGLNPVRLRHAVKYAVNEHVSGDPAPVTELYRDIRAFKAQTSAKFEVPNVTFDSIGGYDGVKAELMRAIRLMAGTYELPNEELRRELIPRGFLFWGPPGTGKTLFAKAIANQLNATIQVVSGPEVTDMYVGESERKVRELFAEARRNAPAVLVFDEFDAIATERSGREDGGTRAGNALVAQILTEMDGFRPDVPMLVIGTTNRLDIVDKALLRPSRFKPVAIGLPDKTARRFIAEIHAQHFAIELSADMLDVIADTTEGFSGDDIRSLFRDACLGRHCQDPPLPADGYRFGSLIGAFKRGRDEQQVAESAQKSTALENLSPGQRPGPSSPLVRRTPTVDAVQSELSLSTETKTSSKESGV